MKALRRWTSAIIMVVVLVTFCKGISYAAEIGEQQFLDIHHHVPRIITEVGDCMEVEPRSAAEPEPEPAPEPEYEKLYTDNDVEIISKIVLREAESVQSNGKVSGDAQRAAVVWCLLNRVDAEYGTIEEVATAKHQFAYYPDTEVKDSIKELVVDVLERWSKEKAGLGSEGRVLPPDYMWFVGDGQYNHFRNKFKGNYTIWDWSLDDPYGDRNDNTAVVDAAG